MSAGIMKTRGRGETVVVPRRVFVEEDPLEYAGLHQAAKPRGEHVAGDCGVARDRVETADAVADLSQNARAVPFAA
jgi:hypothetical protein